MHESLIAELSEKFTTHNWNKKDLLKVLFANEDIKNMYPNEIRRSTIIWQLANTILSQVGNHDSCQVFAIGDIAYFDNLAESWKHLIESSLRSIDTSHLIGYDLNWVGSMRLRKSIITYMSHYYDTFLPTNLEERILPSYGGTDSFTSIINTLRIHSQEKKVNFVYPEASFLANVKIAETLIGKDNLIKLPKPSHTNFFFSTEQIEDFYGNQSRISEVNIFYITPVGNPTGNMIQPNQLYDIALQIVKRDPDAILIFDTVYIWLLIDTASRDLFEKIFTNPSILNRIIFTESISKTLGTTGIRLGWTWTVNQELSDELRNYTTLTKAGFSKILDEFTINLLENPTIIDFQNQVYEFWSGERMKFVNSMKNQFPELFDFESSPSISHREWIYVLLKLQENYSFEEVFAITGIIGVGIELSDGKYIRYAFGNVKSS